MNQFIEKFVKGTQYVNIESAVTVNELTDVASVTDDYLSKKCIKFIPASGAATRMFKDLYQYLEDEIETDFIVRFFDNLEHFAFYGDLLAAMENQGVDRATVAGKTKIVRMVLEDELNYGNLPKAFLKMHAYDKVALTPIDEHIYEGEQYVNSDDVKLHFTISKDHEDLFNAYVDGALKGNDAIDISYSFQKKETDTMAVDMDNEPFVLDNGEVLYRAGGHGSLIENLNDLDGDIVFIKNIDNVCHRSQAADTIDYKKKLAAIGNSVKDKVDIYLEAIESDNFDLDEIAAFLKDTLNITYKEKMTKDVAWSLLNRPLRVCGVVKNQGEPGGGPFVVDNGDYLDLQICEMAEIDLKDEEKAAIVKQSQFFNPVDLVCFIKDYKGVKFDLTKFINQDRYFISEKSYKGRKLKALEHPGLWNGAMHNWNTLFVEVPLSTFNPVKTVNDLLREGHQG